MNLNIHKSKLKANCDVDISHLVTLDIERRVCDEVVLVSGGGDFSILLDFANKMSIKTFIYSFNRKTTAKVLRKKKFCNVGFIIENGAILK